MANGLANIYLKTLSEARYDGSERANEWLTARLGELRAEVQNKQAAASAYRAQRNLLTAQGANLTEAQIAEVQTSLLRTRSEFSQKQSEAAQLNEASKRGEILAAVGAASSSDAMRELRGKAAEMAQKVADLEQRYGPSYPVLQQAKEEQAALNAQLKDEMARVAGKAKMEAATLGAIGL
jgi:uncharacterized protein involved in exopolysaccharide biosynthesis